MNADKRKDGGSLPIRVYLRYPRFDPSSLELLTQFRCQSLPYFPAAFAGSAFSDRMRPKSVSTWA